MKFATFSAVAAACVLVSATHAQEPQDVRSQSISEAWTRFLADNRGEWQVEWNRSLGTPASIWGTGIQVSSDPVTELESARELARQFLNRHADLLGTGASTYVERTAQTVGRVHVLVYDQQFAGLQVLGGRADVRLHNVGRIPMFGASTVPVPAGFGTTPSVEVDVARLVALTNNAPALLEGVAFEDLATRADARLVIWSRTENSNLIGPRLAWEIEVEQRDPMVYGRSYVDALSGDELQWVDGLYECSLGHVHKRGAARPHAEGHIGREIARTRSSKTAEDSAMMSLDGNVSGWVRTTVGAVAPVALVPMPRVLVTSSVGSTLTDANGDFSIPVSGSTSSAAVTVRLEGAHVGNMDNQAIPELVITQTVQVGTPAQFTFSSSSGGEFEWAETTTYWWTDLTNEYLRGIVGNSPELNGLDNVQAFVNIGTQSCNAFYGGNTINFLRSGGGCNNTAEATVIAHEWGHGLDDFYGGISTSGGSQIDGLSEGWGDIVAIYVTEQPIVGPQFTSGGGFIRTALNNKTYPAGGFPLGGAPHPKGEVFMGFAWTVRNNLIASLGAAAGDLRAEEIVLGSVVADAPDQPQAVREVFVLDDDNGNLGDGTVNYADLSAAAQSRDLPFPEIDTIDITGTGIASIPQPFETRVVQATAVGNGTVPGTVTGVDVIYGLDGAALTQRRPMIQVGTAGDYIALLPGVPAGTQLSFRYEAQHSSGATEQFPPASDITYTVPFPPLTNPTTIFFDDFEGGANGWTSVELATQNDWQFGAPQGRNGSSFGVPWQDPTSAFSGTSCRGNDLGIGNFNGRYQPNVVNELRSPVLDLSGFTNARVRFRRWLSVEESQFDRALLRLNGTTLWGNPPFNLLDTSWQFVEYPIPPSLLTANSQFVFRLETDGALNLGGWAIDDFEVVGDNSAASTDLVYAATPAQAQAGQTVNATITGAPNAPFALLSSLFPGPSNFLGLTIDIGANPLISVRMLDSAGESTFSIPVPAGLPPILIYTQAVQAGPNGFQASNPQRLLIGG